MAKSSLSAEVHCSPEMTWPLSSLLSSMFGFQMAGLSSSIRVLNSSLKIFDVVLFFFQPIIQSSRFF